MAKSTKQETMSETEDFNQAAEQAAEQTVEQNSGKKRVHRVANNIEILPNNVLKFSFDIKGLTDEEGSQKVTEFTLDCNAISEANADKNFVMKAAAAGLLSQTQIAYAGVASPVEIETIISDLFTEFANGEFTSRNFADKKPTLPDVVIAWMRHVGKDVNDATEAAKYKAAYDAKKPEEKRLFGLQKPIVKQLEILAQERLAAKAAKSNEVEEIAIEAI